MDSQLIVSRFFSVGLVLTAAVLSGCGGNTNTQAPPPELRVGNPVSGRVVMEGGERSPVSCEVFFYSEDSTNSEKHSIARGNCDEFGYFEMSTNATNDGAPPGKYKVLFYQSALPREAFKKVPEVDALGGKYQDVENPAYTVEIPQGGKKDLSFTLTPLSKEEIEQALADAGTKSQSAKSKE